MRLADAQAAAGDAAGSRDTLLAALRTAEPADRLALTVGVANAEWWIGRTDEAPGGGCTSRSAPCPRSRRPTASGCASRSRSRRS